MAQILRKFGVFFFMGKGRTRFFFVSGEKTRIFDSRCRREIRAFWPLTRKVFLLILSSLAGVIGTPKKN